MDWKRDVDEWKLEYKKEEIKKGEKRQGKDEVLKSFLLKDSKGKRLWHFKRPDFQKGTVSSSIRVEHYEYTYQ